MFVGFVCSFVFVYTRVFRYGLLAVPKIIFKSIASLICLTIIILDTGFIHVVYKRVFCVHLCYAVR